MLASKKGISLCFCEGGKRERLKIRCDVIAVHYKLLSSCHTVPGNTLFDLDKEAQNTQEQVCDNQSQVSFQCNPILILSSLVPM